MNLTIEDILALMPIVDDGTWVVDEDGCIRNADCMCPLQAIGVEVFGFTPLRLGSIGDAAGEAITGHKPTTLEWGGAIAPIMLAADATKGYSKRLRTKILYSVGRLP